MKKAVLYISLLFLTSNTYAAYDTAKPAPTDILARSQQDIKNNFAHIASGDATILGTQSNTFRIGDAANTDKTVSADTGETQLPYIKYVATQDVWTLSNLGNVQYQIVASGDTSNISGAKTFTGNPVFGDATTDTITMRSRVIQVDTSTPYNFYSNDGGASGPNLRITHDSASPANSDVIGLMDVFGKDSAGGLNELAHIQFDAIAVSGSLDSNIELSARTDGYMRDLNWGPPTGTSTNIALWPGQDNANNLGVTGTNRWLNQYVMNPETVESDERNKGNIQDSDLGLDFLKSLKPRKYKWKEREVSDQEGKRRKVPKADDDTHYGFLGQEVEQALKGKKASFVNYDSENDNYTMKPSELIPVLTKAIQELEARVKALEP